MPIFRRTLFSILLAALAILLAWMAWAGHAAAVAAWWTGGTSTAAAAEWGNAFGGFNALIGALGFAAVVATLIVQAAALREQQADLRDQRAELHRQRFEGTFFQLLGLLRELRDEVRFMPSNAYLTSSSRGRVGAEELLAKKTISYGPEAFTTAVAELRHYLTRPRLRGKTVDRAFLARLYEERVHDRYESRLGPYFRMIYTILHRIRHDPVLSEPEKIGYANLLRSQLPSHELQLLAMNALTKAAKDLDDYVVHFHLLKYLPEGTFRGLLIDVFPAAAFAKRD